MPNISTPHKRIRFLTGLCFIVMAVFVVRLFYLQVIRHDFYAQAAEQDQVKSLVIPADRGEIYAMDGETPTYLALNQVVYTAFVNPQQVTKPDEIVSSLKQIAGGNVVPNLTEQVNAKKYQYRIVARNISRQQAELLKQKDLAGLGFQETSKRVYPEGELASQVLGFVNANGQGQYGVEQALNDTLSGKDGLLRATTDVSGIPLTIGSHNTQIPAQDGKNIVLSIDRSVQAYTERALYDQVKKIGAKTASAIVMDPQTGKVLAMANYPTYNPENFNKVTNAVAFDNQVITQPYEPGSVMKTFTVATGIDKGAITAGSTFNNTDYIKVDDAVIGNAEKGVTGTITMQTALKYSLNTGMVTIAQRLGNGSNITLGARKTMYNYLHDRFGLGKSTGIQLAGEQTGEVISPDTVQGNAVRYSNMSFGQGMDITMLQVAAGFSSIINGGQYYQPTVLEGVVDENGDFHRDAAPQPLRRTISESASAQARKMIHVARADFFPGIDKKGYYIGGKTGTSQTIDPRTGKYVDSTTVASYLGFGGDTKPRYVIMVRVAAPGKNFQGNIHAMPVFTKVSNWLIHYMQLRPSN